MAARSGPEGTISVMIVRALVTGGMALGLTPLAIAERAGVPGEWFAPELLADPDARVPAPVVFRLWQVLPEIASDDTFGVWLADKLSGAPLSAAWGVVLTSPTLREGLARALRYQRLIHDGARGELRVEGNEAVYRHQIGAAPFRAPRHAIEFGFASLVKLAERAIGRRVTPVRVNFQHAAPRDTSRHHALFGPGVAFLAPADELVFSLQTLELGLVTADPGLCEVVEAHARELLGRLPESAGTSARVRALICERLRDGPVSMAEIARRLAAPTRTLQRRLKNEATSFGRLLDGVRHELATRYLGDPRLSVQEAAFLLGFSDVSAFHRAFSRWTGMTPAAYRAQASKTAV